MPWDKSCYVVLRTRRGDILVDDHGAREVAVYDLREDRETAKPFTEFSDWLRRRASSPKYALAIDILNEFLLSR